MDIVIWLRSLGLGQYEAVFRENEIDETVLPSRGRTKKTLKELGVNGSWASPQAPRCHCRLCEAMRAARRHPGADAATYAQRPRAPLPKTAPSAAK